VTNLANGFTVLTETPSFPGAVHMGKYQETHTNVLQETFYILIIKTKSIPY